MAITLKKYPVSTSSVNCLLELVHLANSTLIFKWNFRGIQAADAVALGDMARIAAEAAKEVDGGATLEDVVDKA